jgi:rubrerythrin
MAEETPSSIDLDLGTTVYDDDGRALGSVRGFDEEGFYVTLRDGVEALIVELVRSGQKFGEAELMWRCTNCGEMGEIDEGLPDRCTNCGVPKEDLYYWTED